MAVRTLTYVLLGRDELSPVARKAGANVEGTFARLGKMAGMMGLTTGIAAIGYESVKAAASFQASMERVHTQAGASQSSIKGLSEQVLQLGMHAQQSPKELADSLYHLKSVGLDNVNAMKALRTASDLAAVGGSDLESTTNALAGAWRSGIKGAQSFGQTASTVNAIIGAGNMRMEDFVGAIGTGILPAAKTFGVSLQSVGSALALMTDEGVPAEDAATRLRMSLSLLGAPSGAAEKQLKLIGLTGLDLANTMRGPQGLVGAISLLKKHLDESGMSASQQAALLSRAFGGGRSSSAILTMVNNLDVLKKKQDQVNSTTGRYGDAVAQQRRTAQAQFAILKNVLDVLAIRLGTALLPPLTKFAQFLTGTAIPRMQDFGHQVMPVVKNVFGYFTTGLSTISKGLGLLPGPVKIAALAIIGLGVAMRLAAAANPWLLLATAVVLAVGIITKNWRTIGPVFFAVVNAIRSSWNAAIGWFKTTFNDIRTFAVNTWHAIENNFFGKLLIVAVKVWWAATKLVFQLAWIFISGIFQLIAAIGVKTWKLLVSVFKTEWTILKPIIELLGRVFGAILGAIGRTAASTWKTIGTILGFVWRTILKPTIMALWTTFSNVAGFIIHAAAKMFGWVPGVGGKLKQAARAFDTFRDQVNNAINGVRGKTVGVNVRMTAATNPYAGGISGRAAGGGQITGYGGPTSDRAGLWALSDGEWVVKAKSSRKYGYRAMKAVNDGTATIHHAAGGGEVTVKPGTTSSRSIYNSVGTTLSKLVLDAVKHGLFGGASIVNYARSFLGRIPYVWGGTSVPGGADCSGFTQAVYAHFGIRAPRTSEAQYSWVQRTGPVPGGLAFYVSPAGGPPPGHVAIVQDSNTVISQGGGMGPDIRSLHFMPLMGTGIPRGGFPGGGGLGGNGPAHPYATGTVRQIALSLLRQYGWGNQWSSFNALENREASWNMNARNPSSGAYGLAQFINGAGEYAQFGGNWYTALGQLTAMMNYIRQRYGSPNSAWRHEVNFGWYDRGGFLKPGWNIAYNGTGKPEPVGHNMRGGGNTYNINISPTPLARPADIGREVVGAIKQFEKGSGSGWRKN